MWSLSTSKSHWKVVWKQKFSFYIEQDENPSNQNNFEEYWGPYTSWFQNSPQNCRSQTVWDLSKNTDDVHRELISPPVWGWRVFYPGSKTIRWRCRRLQNSPKNKRLWSAEPSAGLNYQTLPLPLSYSKLRNLLPGREAELLPDPEMAQAHNIFQTL